MAFRGVISGDRGICLSMAALFLLVLSVISAPPVYALPFYTDLFITAKTVDTNEPLVELPALVTFQKVDTGTNINLTKILDKRGTFNYKISQGNWRVILFIDNSSTPEVDYAGSSVFSIDKDIITVGETIYVDPIGSVDVKVIDQEGKMVDNADLKLKCKTNEFLGKTDLFGSYKFYNLPAGKCKAYAAYKDLGGSESITISQGQSTSVEIRLVEPMVSGGYVTYAWIGGIALAVLILLAAIYVLFHRRKGSERLRSKEKRPSKAAAAAKASPMKKASKASGAPKGEPAASKSTGIGTEEPKEGLNPRARDIMKTLNDKEQKVVQFLMEQNNKSTQAGIRNSTGIPKTSLARILQSLESKKVFKVEVIGKLKKVELTDWFLGKE